uniref:BED-type domain-containing protein n=1 Tax=Cucumis melo TaxID=3656 RepID=A0A9I9EE28_CUCME
MVLDYDLSLGACGVKVQDEVKGPSQVEVGKGYNPGGSRVSMVGQKTETNDRNRTNRCRADGKILWAVGFRFFHLAGSRSRPNPRLHIHTYRSFISHFPPSWPSQLPPPTPLAGSLPQSFAVTHRSLVFPQPFAVSHMPDQFAISRTPNPFVVNRTPNLLGTYCKMFDLETIGEHKSVLGILKLNQMDSTNMELECDGSCETSKIVRDEDTDGKRKTIDVDLDSYGREDVLNPSKIRKNVKQSMVWDHFERLKGDPNDPRAKCKYCGVVYACHSKRNGTGTMKHHLENCKKYPYQKKRDQTQMTLAFKPKDKVGDNSPQLVCESFSLDGCGEALVEMIIVDELPFKFVAGKGFKKFVDKLTCGNHTRFVVPSRFTVARDVLKLYVNEKNRLKDILEDEDASYRHDMSPNKEDWTNARILIQFLKVFYEGTLKISGSLYTTSNLVFHQITVVQNYIRLNAGSGNALLVGMAKNMKAKFEKYWGNNEKNNLLLYVAIVLDPRKKLRFVAESMGNVVEQCCRRLFHEYITTRSGSRQGCSSTSTTNTQTVSGLDANIDFDSNENVGEDFVYDC